MSRASGRAGQGRTSDIVCAKGYTIGKLAKYGTAYATADGVSSFVSKQSWTNRRLLQLQLTEQALQSASSSGKLQQYLPTMTAVSMWIGKDALTTESATAQLQDCVFTHKLMNLPPKYQYLPKDVQLLLR